MSVNAHVERLKLRYAAWMALMPTVVFVVTFAGLCAYECAASPWAAFLAAPVISIIIGSVVMGIYLGRASQLGTEQGAQLRRFVMWSPLWGPLLAGATLLGLLALLSEFMAILDRWVA